MKCKMCFKEMKRGYILLPWFDVFICEDCRCGETVWPLFKSVLFDIFIHPFWKGGVNVVEVVDEGGGLE